MPEEAYTVATDSMTKEQTAQIITRITDYSGIRVAPVLVSYVATYVEKQASISGCSCSEYCHKLKVGTPEFNRLITEITTNETYFFREQRQFNLLKEQVFPRFSGRKMVIWSAAGASGEEAVSLYALAVSCGVTPQVYATDIDQNELAFFRNGIYTRSSFCEDGKIFHPLLVASGCGLFDDTKFRLHPSFLNKLKIYNYNLVGNDSPPIDEPVNLVFLRNVFIYFDDECRRAVLRKLSNVLAPGGLIFLSFSEIGSITEEMIPQGMEKVNVGPVYFLVKKPYKQFQEKKQGLHPIQSLHSRIKETKHRNSHEATIPEPKESTPVQNHVVKAQSNPPLPPQPLLTTEPLKHDKMVLPEVPKPEYMFHVLKWLIAANEFDVARNIVSNYNPLGNEGLYSSFYKGYIEKAARNVDVADQFFSHTEKNYPEFWPAYFYHGILLKEHSRDVEAVPFFKQCAALLEEYEKSGRTEFDFLAETFSPDYFYVLCMKFMRLE